MLIRTSTPVPPRHGLSVVEFMVGVAVGLVILVGVTKVFVDYVNGNRLQLIEIRVNQDLRAAADIVSRDLRRGGYWRNAVDGLWKDGSAPAASNPHAALTPTSGNATEVTYSYAKDGNNALDANTEDFGFKVEGQALKFKNAGGGWTPITDDQSVRVTGFTVTPTSYTVQLAESCSCIARGTCSASAVISSGTGPRLTVRRFDITLVGQAVADSRIQRRYETTVRVRNDAIAGACPS